MNVEALPITQEKTTDFDTQPVLTIVGGHFINDCYASFISPLLPLLIHKLSLSLTAAGSFSALAQLPAALNPLIGYLADRYRLKYLIILAPALTGTFTSLLGLAPNPLILGILLLLSGFSTAAFHAPAPAMIGSIAPKKLGKGMAWFMAGGEFGYTIGPLLIVWAVSVWTLEGTFRVMVLGWAASLILYLRLRNYTLPTKHPLEVAKNSIHWRSMLPDLLRCFIPLSGVVFLRNFIVVFAIFFLPTFLHERGESLWVSGAALSIVEFFGVGGALVGGPLSDRIGRKPILLITFSASFIILMIFLNVHGMWIAPFLALLGFFSISSGPIFLAIAQENFPHQRAIANGIYMALAFLLQSLNTIIIGIMGDHLGMTNAFFWCGIISLLSLPVVFMLPKHHREHLKIS